MAPLVTSDVHSPRIDHVLTIGTSCAGVRPRRSGFVVIGGVSHVAIVGDYVEKAKIGAPLRGTPIFVMDRQLWSPAMQ